MTGNPENDRRSRGRTRFSFALTKGQQHGRTALQRIPGVRAFFQPLRFRTVLRDFVLHQFPHYVQFFGAQ